MPILSIFWRLPPISNIGLKKGSQRLLASEHSIRMFDHQSLFFSPQRPANFSPRCGYPVVDAISRSRDCERMFAARLSSGYRVKSSLKNAATVPKYKILGGTLLSWNTLFASLEQSVSVGSWYYRVAEWIGRLYDVEASHLFKFLQPSRRNSEGFPLTNISAFEELRRLWPRLHVPFYLFKTWLWSLRASFGHRHRSFWFTLAVFLTRLSNNHFMVF